MREEMQVAVPANPDDWRSLALRWCRAYGLKLREMPSLKLVEAADPKLGFPVEYAAGDFPDIYRKFVENIVKLTKAENVEGLKIQIDLRESSLLQRNANT